MNLRRVTVAAFCVVAAAFGSVAGCSTDAEDRSAVAAAKCSLPVDEEADFAETETDSPAQKEDVIVTSLGQGSYRVTGRAIGHDLDGHVRSVDFVCEVAPDSSDKLRGFKVTSLTVT